MTRKKVVSGPVSGPVVEVAVDRGPGCGVLKADKRQPGKVPRRYTINGGFKPDER